MIDDIKQRLSDGEALVPIEVNALLAHERDAYISQINDMKIRLAKRREPMSERATFLAAVIVLLICVTAPIMAAIMSAGPSVEEALVSMVLEAKDPPTHSRTGEPRRPDECDSHSVLQSTIEQLGEVCKDWEDERP